jgi:hypothetical protein
MGEMSTGKSIGRVDEKNGGLTDAIITSINDTLTLYLFTFVVFIFGIFTDAAPFEFPFPTPPGDVEQIYEKQMTKTFVDEYASRLKSLSSSSEVVSQI